LIKQNRNCWKTKNEFNKKSQKSYKKEHNEAIKSEPVINDTIFSKIDKTTLNLLPKNNKGEK